MTQAILPAPSISSHRDRFFDTSHLAQDLKKRTIRGGAVTLSSQSVKFVLRMGSTAVLARLLTPADFGVIAMVTVVTGFVEMFKDAGLSMATVQREKITHAQVSMLFWINVALSIVIMGVIAALAPAIAWFYGDPRLTNITLALACTMIFGGVAVQHQALLQRKMQFGRLAITELTSMAVGVVVAVLMAWRGFGYWSLVGMTAAGSVTAASMSVFISGWIPSLPVLGCGVRPMLAFGGNLTGFSFANYFSRNADNFLIGKVLGPSDLGLYAKAYGLLMLPIQQIVSPIAAVAIPALSRLQSEPQRFRSTYLKALRMSCWASMPVLGAAAGCADLIVRLILGEQWLQAANVFQILAIAAVLQPAANTTGWLYQAAGRTAAMFRWGIGSSIVITLSFLIGLPWGIQGVATSYVICYVAITYVPCFYFATRGTSITVSDILKVTLLPLLISVVLFAAVRTATASLW